MESLLKKVAYLQGLADGLDIDDSSDEGRVLLKIIDVLDDMSDALADLAVSHDELYEQVEAIDEDLADLETEVYEGDDYDYDDDDDDLDYFEIECPHCKELVCIDEDLLEDDAIICPNCEQEIEIEFSCDCDDCDCDCDCE